MNHFTHTNHTHTYHSPAAKALKEITGAPTFGLAHMAVENQV